MLAALACYSAAQPAVNYRGIVNVASYSPAGLPNGSIAQGSVFAIFGSNIGPTQGVQVSAFPISTTLAGVSITVTQGATTLNALPLYVSAGQVNALMPSNAPLGMVSVRLQYGGATSNASPVSVIAASVGIFAANSAGSGPGIIQDASQTGTPINATNLTAKPGDTMVLWGTGLGPATFPDNGPPKPGNLATVTEVFVGGISAQVVYNGRSGCCSGTDQIVFVVPGNAPQGCWVPVYVRTGGSLISNVVSMAIDPNGASCSDPSNPQARTFTQGGKLGALQLIRSVTHEDIGTISPLDVSDDYFSFDLSQVAGGSYGFGALFSAPPAGTCTVYSGAGDVWHDSILPGTPVTRTLDAGTLALSGPGGNISLAPDVPSVNVTFLGSFAPFLAGLPNQLYLDPGTYTITAPGGADVQSFSVSVTQAAPFSWTNRDQTGLVYRNRDLTLTWTGLPSGQQMAVMGGNVDLPTNSSAFFYCVAPANSTGFTVPTAILSSLPPTRTSVLQSKSMLYLTNVLPSNGTSFSAKGLDSAMAMAGYLMGKTVFFQ